MEGRAGAFSGISKSGFMRSVITRVLAITVVVSIIIACVAFFSFTSELRKNILLDRQRQLSVVEETISERLEEVTSIAYNIGSDPAFYLESVHDDPTEGSQMSEMLRRYLVGNSFIEHLAYCRTAEPDTIYTSRGVRSLSEFYVTSMGMDPDSAQMIIDSIHKEAQTDIRVSGAGDNAYFSYAYPLPQLSPVPKAHVLILIPVSEVRPLLESLLIGSGGRAIVFDAAGIEKYSVGQLDDRLELEEYIKSGAEQESYTSPSGQQYVLQKAVSDTNGWTYVSVMRYSDTLTGLANKQLALIALILVILIAAVVLMLASILVQYRPISTLAQQVADSRPDEVIDERTLLTHTIAALKDDSQQKQKYESAYYAAEAANKAKSAFLSSMSHDIRTPMNAIVGMTAIALKHKDEPEYVEECLRKVQLSSDYLLDIINNVLDMSRIESGRVPIANEGMLIPAVVDSVVSLMSSSVEAKGQSLTVDMAPLSQSAVLGDSIHLTQVFVNILSNAIKFTPEGGALKLTVRQTPCEEAGFGSYTFAFSDTGIGIPPEFVDQVFDTFTRASGPINSKTEGTGLGMAIAKKLVELMGGEISCESELGRGTTFTVKLRMELTSQEEALRLASAGTRTHNSHAEINTALDLTGRRILLVEDNAMNREIARRIIGETGAEVVEAEDGRQAVESFASHNAGYFDLIFMDIQMPEMNGCEATAAIRAMDRADAATIPIFAMTANTFDEDVRQVQSSGMNGHIGKPYNPAAVYKVLEQTLVN